MSLVFALIIGALFAFAYVAIDMLSTVRAYVGGESLYSKAEKDAAYHLTRYAVEHDQSQYERFLHALAVNAGDRDARIALEDPKTDLSVADEAFLRGRNHPEDVRTMGIFFRRFRRVSYIDKAIAIWAEGDRLNAELLALGVTLHDKITNGTITPAEQQATISAIDSLDERLGVLEDDFSFTLGEAGRWLEDVLFWTMVVATGMFLAFGLKVASVVSGTIREDIDTLCKGTERVAEGDLTSRISVGSDNELSVLARAFNRMTSSLLESRSTMIANVAERERAELELERSVSVLKATLESIGEGILVVDREGNLGSYNRQFADMWRIPEEILAARDDKRAVAFVGDQLKDPRAFSSKIAEVYATPEIETEDVLEFRDGRIFERSSRPQLIGGVSAGRVWRFRDVTAQRQLQARLVATDRMASMGVLAAGVGHEINNPLMYVVSNLELLAEELPNVVDAAVPDRAEELKELLADAREGADRVRRIVRDLNAMSRSDESAIGPVDLGRVLHFATNIAMNDIRHRARLVKDYGEVPLVAGNAARLGQVFLNLLVNAAQAIREGNVEHNEVRIVTRTTAAGAALVEVHDTGGGIAPENLESIFLPFFTTKPIGSGTGLGLAISHGIITSLGGEITVESEVGKGCVFRVLLPAAPQSAETVTAPSAPAPSARRARLLVVDDNVQVGITIKRLLGKEHDVTLVTNGRQAMAYLGPRSNVDVILCDVMMPEMSGMDLHAALLETAPERAEKMIFMTGGAFTPMARDFLARAPNARVEKPIDAAQLRALIRRVLSDEPAHRGASPRVEVARSA
ncbi:MAG TPA: ATP-binding protein [Labilithrix sp.]|nr:ATP-binding protein [Labilithrix sp.]